MNNNNKNIDQILREKFKGFAPMPPAHVWEGIRHELDMPKPVPFYKNKFVVSSTITIVALLALLFFWFKPISNITNNNIINTQQPQVSLDSKVSTSAKQNPKIEGVVEEEVVVSNVDKHNIAKTNSPIDIVEPTKTNSFNLVAPNEVSVQNDIDKLSDIELITYKSCNAILVEEDIYFITPDYVTEEFLVGDVTKNISTGANISQWEMGYYISPELSITSLDSIQLLNNYSISVQPTYNINKHWYIKSGLGLSFVRDQGFAKIDYVKNEYMGSYDDVYDVTFDTTGGVVTPIYYTKSVEVWDSIPHVLVQNVTNKYLYLQVPLLFGYNYHKSGSKMSMYFQAGPVFNIKVAGWIENPSYNDGESEIIKLTNNLPVRSTNYFQLWVGAGIKYSMTSRISIAVEPQYRYYFNGVYNNSVSINSLSGMSINLGMVYKINN